MKQTGLNKVFENEVFDMISLIVGLIIFVFLIHLAILFPLFACCLCGVLSICFGILSKIKQEDPRF